MQIENRTTKQTDPNESVFWCIRWLWHIWSLTHMVPGHLVPYNWSPIDWSLWTDSPQPIQSPWTNGALTFGPSGQLVPLDKWLDKLPIEYSVCPGGQVVGIWNMGTKLVWDHLSRGTKSLGTICPGGPYLMGTVCPAGGSIFRDRCSRGTGSGRPEVRELNGFGTKCIAAFRCRL